MPVGLGHKSYLQLGKEVTYGSPATVNRRFEIISANIAPQKGVIQDPSLNNSPSRRGIFEGATVYKGTILTRLNYAGQEELFRGVFGAYNGATTVTDGRDHVFKEASAIPSYTMELSIGDMPATNQVFDLYGAKFTGVTIRGTAGQGTDAMLQAEFSVIAKDMVSAQSATGSLSAELPRPVIFHSNNNAGGGAIVDDGIETLADGIRVRSFEVTLENPHAEDRFYLSSSQVDEPVRNDFLVARWRFTQEFTSIAQFNAIRTWAATGSEPSPRLVFQGSLIVATNRYEFELRSNKAQYVEWSAPVEGYGIVTSTATLEAFYDSTDQSALVARIRNSLAALT